MGTELQHYTLILRTEGPVFIGSGQKIGKKEYIYDRRDNLVHIPDMRKMFAFFMQRGLMPAYEDYLLNDRRDFSSWLYQNRVSARDYGQWIAYTLDSGDAFVDKDNRREILTAMKDAYGCPYVPGSSLKGALRTVLLGAVMLRKSDAFARERAAVKNADLRGPSKRILSREAAQAEQHMYNRLKRNEKRKEDAVNDIMSGLRIGDSEPLGMDALVLCQKIDIMTDGKERALPIFRECIRPGTEIRFPVTINPEYFHYTPQKIEQAATIFAENYDRCFLNHFPVNGISGGGNLYLGGGCGYVSKTVSYPLLGTGSAERVSKIIDATLPPSIRRAHKHYKDAGLGVSPHMLKCTQYDGRLYEMGACTLKFQ